MSRTRRLVGAALLVLLLAVFAAWLSGLLAPQQSAPSPAQRFARWQVGHERDVADYQSFLQRRGVGAVLPAEQLFRLGRRWQSCGAGEFAVPPSDRWPGIVPTLRLLADLRAEGLLDGARVASGYRPLAYNRCEGGSPASRHLSNEALDLDLADASPSSVKALCATWRRLGPRHRWGLGFYSAKQIHLDTSGFRTWGSDFHRQTSLCSQPD